MAQAALPRSIVHPGPETPERFRAIACHVHPVTLTVRAGMCVNEAIAAAFAERGFEGGYIRLKNVPMKRLEYVMPAAAPEPAISFKTAANLWRHLAPDPGEFS